MCPQRPFSGDAAAIDRECGGNTDNPRAEGLECSYASGVSCRCARWFEPNAWVWACVQRAGDALCPIVRPREATGCRSQDGGYGGWDFSGARCDYGAVTCECRSVDQGTSRWSCAPAAGDGGR